MMSPETFLEIITEEGIQIVPLQNLEGNTIRWTAGKRVYSSTGNYVPNHMVAKGNTPVEALENLLIDRTIIKTDPYYSSMAPTEPNTLIGKYE